MLSRHRLSTLFFFSIALFTGSCNLYQWSYSEEESADFATVMAGAEYSFDSRDYDKAIILYKRATQIHPKDAWPRHRTLQCLLLRNTPGGHSLLRTHSPLFDPGPYSFTNALFHEWKPLAGVRLAQDCAEGASLINQLQTNTNLYWSRLAIDDPSVLRDNALTSALHGLLLLQDANTNTILLEADDPGRIDTSFTYTMTNTLDPTAKTNLARLLSQATNSLSRARYSLDTLFIQNPANNQEDTAWQSLSTNLGRALESTTTVLTNLGVL